MRFGDERVLALLSALVLFRLLLREFAHRDLCRKWVLCSVAISGPGR